jgi:hypothetical protein
MRFCNWLIRCIYQPGNIKRNFYYINQGMDILIATAIGLKAQEVLRPGENAYLK